MLHIMPHLISYTRWYNDEAEAEWVVGQAAGKEKFEDVHPSPDYIAGRKSVPDALLEGLRWIWTEAQPVPNQSENEPDTRDS